MAVARHLQRPRKRTGLKREMFRGQGTNRWVDLVSVKSRVFIAISVRKTRGVWGVLSLAADICSVSGESDFPVSHGTGVVCVGCGWEGGVRVRIAESGPVASTCGSGPIQRSQVVFAVI